MTSCASSPPPRTPPRHQRADRSGTSVPGDRRFPHTRGAPRTVTRPHDRLYRGRQQRGDVARACRRDARRPRPHREPGAVSAAARGRPAGDGGRPPRRAPAAVQRAADAVAGADAVYTDTWTSMGQESEAAVRQRIFAPFQVNDELMSLAKPGALFMHCLPAHRGEEVTAEVFESDASVVFDQAENRLHSQKALLLMLLAPTAAVRRRWRCTGSARRHPDAERAVESSLMAAPWLAHYDPGVPRRWRPTRTGRSSTTSPTRRASAPKRGAALQRRHGHLRRARSPERRLRRRLRGPRRHARRPRRPAASQLPAVLHRPVRRLEARRHRRAAEPDLHRARARGSAARERRRDGGHADAVLRTRQARSARRPAFAA